MLRQISSSGSHSSDDSATNNTNSACKHTPDREYGCATPYYFPPIALPPAFFAVEVVLVDGVCGVVVRSGIASGDGVWRGEVSCRLVIQAYAHEGETGGGVGC